MWLLTTNIAYLISEPKPKLIFMHFPTILAGFISKEKFGCDLASKYVKK